MAKLVLYTVNFGASNGGLSTVGYTIYKTDGTLKIARSTSGVVEVGSSTGIYAVQLSLAEEDNIVVLWDTGTASPRYAAEEYRNQLNSIQDETDNIRLILNSMRNQGVAYDNLSEKMVALKKSIEALGEVVSGIDKKAIPSVEEIRRVLGTTVNTPETKIEEIKNMLSGIKNAIVNESGRENKNLKNFENVMAFLSTLKTNLDKTMNDRTNTISNHIKVSQKVFAKLDGLITKITEFNAKLETFEGNDKKIIKAKLELQNEIAKINAQIKKIVGAEEIDEPTKTLMAFGNYVRMTNG